MRNRKHSFAVDFYRCMGWIILSSFVVIIALRIMNPGVTEEPPIQLPQTTVTQPLPTATHVAVTEDDPGWNCTTQGNRICGPGSGHPAGCYSGGVLVIPWTNYTSPRSDPLWAQVKSPC